MICSDETDAQFRGDASDVAHVASPKAVCFHGFGLASLAQCLQSGCISYMSSTAKLPTDDGLNMQMQRCLEYKDDWRAAWPRDVVKTTRATTRLCHTHTTIFTCLSFTTYYGKNINMHKMWHLLFRCRKASDATFKANNDESLTQCNTPEKPH